MKVFYSKYFPSTTRDLFNPLDTTIENEFFMSSAFSWLFALGYTIMMCLVIGASASGSNNIKIFRFFKVTCWILNIANMLTLLMIILGLEEVGFY